MTTERLWQRERRDVVRAVGVVRRNWILDKYLKAEQSVEFLIS